MSRHSGGTFLRPKHNFQGTVSKDRGPVRRVGEGRQGPAPNTPTFSGVAHDSLYLNWTPSGDGGSAITSYDINYGPTSGANTTLYMGAVSPQFISGLTPGTLYYFRVRANNAIGNGAWSTIVSQQTIAGVRVRDGGTWKFAIPYVKVAGVWKTAIPFVKVGGVWEETI